MKTFWMISNREAEKPLELNFLPVSQAGFAEKPSTPGLYLPADAGDDLSTANGRTLYSIGCFIYRGKWGRQALDLANRDLAEKSLDEVMKNSRGQFCLVVHENGGVAIAADRMASFPIYRYESGNGTQISNLLLPLAKSNSVTFDVQAIAEYLSFNYPISSTFFKEIKPLQRGMIYRFGPNRGETQYDDYLSGLEPGKYTDPDQVASSAVELLKASFSFLAGGDRILADLTGGFDTRTNVVILTSAGLPYETGICGEQEPGELKLAENVARQLGVGFNPDIHITEQGQFDQLLDEHLHICGGIPIPWHSTELINYYHHIAGRFDIHVAGFAGTQLFDQFLPDLSLFSRKLNMYGLFEKRFKYSDLFPGSAMNKSAFYPELERKFNAIIEPVGSREHAHVATALALGTFNRFYHGTLIGAHTAITPLYCPYLDAELARLMIQTDYSLKKYRLIQRKVITRANPEVASLMTSHGFSASADATFAGRRTRIRKPLKDLGRRLIYQFNGLRKMRKAIRRRALRTSGTGDAAEIHRDFWVQAVERAWSNDLGIYSVIDRTKLARHLQTHPHSPRLKAKILYLDWLLRQTTTTA